MMLKITPAIPPDGRLTILCLGAHCDDIEIGCGGTLLRWLKEYPGTSCRWEVFSGNEERRRECQASADAFLAEASERRVDVLGYRDGFLPYQGEQVKDKFERLKREINPDVVFTHYLQDRHQDHRLLSELTWNTFRDHLILEYEIPKYDGDFGSPNVFVALDEDQCRCKSEHLMRHYRTQAGKRWFCKRTFQAVLQLRAMECGLAEGGAEAFYARKLVL